MKHKLWFVRAPLALLLCAGFVQAGTIFQAESYTGISGSSKSSKNGGYTGSGYVDFGGNGSWMEWNNINVPVAGDYTLTLRYANGSSGNRQTAAIINGANRGNVSFEKTGSWKNWNTETITVSLIKGNNRIRIQANTGAGGPNLDSLDVEANAAAAANVSGDNLLVDQELTTNQRITSNNGKNYLVLQGDGNLVVYASGTAVWATGTNGKGAVRLRLQGDGNLVLRNAAGSALWSSGTNGTGGARLTMQDDGNLVLRNASGASVWSTKTAQTTPKDTTKPVITLTGNANVSIIEGSVFSDPGATATDDTDGNITSKIVVSGTVNTNTPGSYTLQYNVKDAAGNSAATVTRNIVVTPAAKDTLATDVDLKVNQRITSANGSYYLTLQSDGNLVLYTQAGKALWASGTNGKGAVNFRLQGDGNLVLRNAAGSAVWSSKTNGKGGTRLLVQNDGNLVLLNAAGNAVWSTNTAVSGNTPDTTKPVIKLNGASNDIISQGTSFRDPGASASDNIDGDITNKIVISGSVNSNVPATYVLQYNVRDAAGNAADTARRTVVVTASSGGGTGGGGGNSGGGTAVSTGEFSSPNAALYSLNDSRSRGFPKVIDTGFAGNGHAETWDGRIFVRTQTAGWFASAFRPERIVRNSDGSVDFKQGAFGNSIQLEAKADAPDMQLNWLAIVPDFSVSGENPYPSNASGSFAANGTYRTYKALVYHTSTRNGDNDQMGLRKATFIVSNANTRDAQLISARFTNGFEKFRLQSGADFRCIEPSVTVDGRLVVCQGHPDNNGRIDNLVYSWNPTPGALTNWRTPKSITNMYWDDRTTNVDGIPFYVRFPIAEKPLRDATGNDYNRNELVKGAYPWISHDGTELFYQASREGVSARRTGTTVVGRWTGWLFRHIDGPINPY